MSGYREATAVGGESTHSAVSWGAILAGAAAALATTVVLLVLGAGFGLTSISPYGGSGVSATTFGIMTAIGLIVVQWISAFVGGFVTGRLRTKWAGLHTDEVFFRDTAHGFVMWAVTALVGATLLASATTSLLGTGASAVSSVAGGAAQGASTLASQAASSVSGYDVDKLFRSDKPDATDASAAAQQATRILANGLSTGDVPAADRTYLAQLVSNRAGISQADAQQRVDQAIEGAKQAAAKAKQAAESARKAGAQVSIFTGLSMLIGAFIASVAAALGGRARDD